MSPEIRLTQAASDEPRLAEMIARTGTEAGMDPYITGDTYYWLIEIEKDGIFVAVGYTGVHSLNWIARRCRGLLWIAPEFRRMGLGEQTLKKRNAMLFDQWNMNRIEWVIPVDASASLSLSAKLGQHCEGILRQVIYYDGAYHDYAMYSFVRSDREAIATARLKEAG